MPPNGLELSRLAARATAHPLSRNSAGKAPSAFPHASQVSCRELFGGSAPPSAASPRLKNDLLIRREIGGAVQLVYADRPEYHENSHHNPWPDDSGWPDREEVKQPMEYD